MPLEPALGQKGETFFSKRTVLAQGREQVWFLLRHAQRKGKLWRYRAIGLAEPAIYAIGKYPPGSR